MKSKLLRKLRDKGRSKITVFSITKTGGIATGMSYGFNENEYKGLFSLGDTEEDVKEKAARIYIERNIDLIRKKYKK